MPELIEHGSTGFLACSETEAVAAAGCLSGLDCAAVRAHAERFPVTHMVDAYLATYHAVLSKQ